MPTVRFPPGSTAAEIAREINLAPQVYEAAALATGFVMPIPPILTKALDALRVPWVIGDPLAAGDAFAEMVDRRLERLTVGHGVSAWAEGMTIRLTTRYTAGSISFTS